MLLNFRVANHRSIREEQELQLHPAFDADRPEGTDWEAVPVVGIFGANAAGKSNVLDALEYTARMVVGSHRDAEPDGGIVRYPFRLDEAAREEPSWYVVDLLLEGVRHTYGFSVDDERVVNEWLFSYPRGRKRVIFERTVDDVEPGDSQTKSELKLVESITEPNVLFMSLAARSNQPDFRPVYDWFARGLEFRRPNVLVGSPLRLWEQAKKQPELMGLLRAADLGIEDCGTERVLFDEEELRRRFSGAALQRRLAELEATGPREGHRLWIGHRGRQGMVQMSLEEQSAGTRALLQQAPRFVSVLRGGGTLVLDEIDASLHPLLTARLIGLFQDPSTNPAGAQIIFTSHDVTLLGRVDGEDILKRDQVWFVEKNEYGESEIVALAEFKPRKDENRERRYLGGSYGGVPFIDDGFVRALRAQGDERDEDAQGERPEEDPVL